MVRAGEDLRVIDNKTKSDLTEVTLTQALLSSERKKRGSVSIDSLKHLLAQGGELLQSRVSVPVARAASEAERTVEKWRNEAEKTVERVLAKKDGSRDEDAATEPEAATTAEPEVATEAASPGLKKSAPKLVEHTQRAYDELQTRMDERVRLLVSALTAPSQNSDEVLVLKEKVKSLESRVAKLEALLAAASEDK